MIITTSNKPIRVIGYPQSTITQEGLHFFSNEWHDEVLVITPDEFLSLPNKHDYQYMVFFTIDTELRIKIISIIEELSLECFSYINDTVVFYKDFKNLPAEEILKIIGHGTIIGPFSTVLINSLIGNHCIIETYCLISHYVQIKNNVILHSGTMLAGRTIIGSNSVFNFKSSVLNALTVCDGVEVGALSNVTKDITVSGRYIGSVARYVGERIAFGG
jgi:acetyltransferase-like isoleucine patch superfamily enzyme